MKNKEIFMLSLDYGDNDIFLGFFSKKHLNTIKATYDLITLKYDTVEDMYGYLESTYEFNDLNRINKFENINTILNLNINTIYDIIMKISCMCYYETSIKQMMRAVKFVKYTPQEYNLLYSLKEKVYNKNNLLYSSFILFLDDYYLSENSSADECYKTKEIIFVVTRKCMKNIFKPLEFIEYLQNTDYEIPVFTNRTDFLKNYMELF